MAPGFSQTKKKGSLEEGAEHKMESARVDHGDMATHNDNRPTIEPVKAKDTAVGVVGSQTRPSTEAKQVTKRSFEQPSDP
jgi:hypothetical protein